MSTERISVAPTRRRGHLLPPVPKVRMQIRLTPSAISHFQGLSPRLKRRVVAALITSAAEGVDVPALLGAVEELRRAGVNLNQALHIAHIQREFPPELTSRIREFLSFLDRLRGRA